MYSQSSPTICAELRRRGSFVDARNNLGNSPLHELVTQCPNQTFCDTLFLKRIFQSLLINEEIDLDAINKDRKTALEILESNRIDEEEDSILAMSTSLVNTGANPTVRTSSYLAVHSKPKDQRSLFSEFLQRLLKKDKPLIKMHIKNNKTLINNWQDRFVGNAYVLFYLVENFDQEVVETFLTFGGDAWKRNQYDELALNVALENGFFRTVQVLLVSMKAADGSTFTKRLSHNDDLCKSILTNMQNKRKPINVNYNKCMEILLENGVIPDLNTVLDLTSDVAMFRLLSNKSM